MDDFDYYIKPKPIPRIAFGSSLHRETLPMRGPCLTSFMRKMQGEIREFPGPSDNAVKTTLLKNYPSKAGYSAFASKLPRLVSVTESTSPPIGAYNIEPEPDKKQLAKPFNSGVERLQEDTVRNLGPALYNYHISMPQYKITMNFGTCRKTTPAIRVVCSPFHTARCKMCDKKPIGDYYHNHEKHIDICRPCWKKEVAYLKSCSTSVFYRMNQKIKLDKFQKARYCLYFHDHAGTKAALRTMDKRTQNFVIAKENYLSRYFTNY